MRSSVWQQYMHGRYLDAPRVAHVGEYRLRVDDQLDLIYGETGVETANGYRLNIGDEIQIDSTTDADLNHTMTILPDGTITPRMIDPVKASGLTVPQLVTRLKELYIAEFYNDKMSLTVSPLRSNSKLKSLISMVDSRYGSGGTVLHTRVTPEGTISLPSLGSVPMQGLTLTELGQELNERYRQLVEGIEVTPVLRQRAPVFFYVLGEVAKPDRYEMQKSTSLLMALGRAGSWNKGANIRQVVILRRTHDWRLTGTIVNVEGALRGTDLRPAGDIWLADADVIIVPKSKILVAADFIELVFSRGIYGVVPLGSSISFSKLGTI